MLKSRTRQSWSTADESDSMEDNSYKNNDAEVDGGL